MLTFHHAFQFRCAFCYGFHSSKNICCAVHVHLGGNSSHTISIWVTSLHRATFLPWSWIAFWPTNVRCSLLDEWPNIYILSHTMQFTFKSLKFYMMPLLLQFGWQFFWMLPSHAFQFTVMATFYYKCSMSLIDLGDTFAKALLYASRM